MTLRREIYQNSILQRIIEVFRDAAGAARFRVEDPPGTEIENRAATAAEENRLVAFERRQAREAAVNRLQALSVDDLEGHTGSVLADVLIAEGRRVPEQDVTVIAVQRVSASLPAVANVEIRADSFPRGMAGYTMHASLVTPAIANITDVLFPAFGLVQHEPDPVAGQAVRFAVADAAGIAQRGATNVLLATLQITGLIVGRTAVQLHVTSMDDDNGNGIITRVRDGVVVFS